VIGAVAELEGKTRVDMQLAGIKEVQIVARESLTVDPSVAGAIPRAAKELAGRIHDRLLTHAR